MKATLLCVAAVLGGLTLLSTPPALHANEIKNVRTLKPAPGPGGDPSGNGRGNGLTKTLRKKIEDVFSKGEGTPRRSQSKRADKPNNERTKPLATIAKILRPARSLGDTDVGEPEPSGLPLPTQRSEKVSSKEEAVVSGQGADCYGGSCVSPLLERFDSKAAHLEKVKIPKMTKARPPKVPKVPKTRGKLPKVPKMKAPKEPKIKTEKQRKPKIKAPKDKAQKIKAPKEKKVTANKIPKFIAPKPFILKDPKVNKYVSSGGNGYTDQPIGSYAPNSVYEPQIAYEVPEQHAGKLRSALRSRPSYPQSDSYSARRLTGSYADPENLEDAINIIAERLTSGLVSNPMMSGFGVFNRQAGGLQSVLTNILGGNLANLGNLNIMLPGLNFDGLNLRRLLAERQGGLGFSLLGDKYGLRQLGGSTAAQRFPFSSSLLTSRLHNGPLKGLPMQESLGKLFRNPLGNSLSIAGMSASVGEIGSSEDPQVGAKTSEAIAQDLASAREIAFGVRGYLTEMREQLRSDQIAGQGANPEFGLDSELRRRLIDSSINESTDLLAALDQATALFSGLSQYPSLSKVVADVKRNVLKFDSDPANAGSWLTLFVAVRDLQVELEALVRTPGFNETQIQKINDAASAAGATILDLRKVIRGEPGAMDPATKESLEKSMNSMVLTLKNIEFPKQQAGDNNLVQGQGAGSLDGQTIGSILGTLGIGGGGMEGLFSGLPSLTRLLNLGEMDNWSLLVQRLLQQVTLGGGLGGYGVSEMDERTATARDTAGSLNDSEGVLRLLVRLRESVNDVTHSGVNILPNQFSTLESNLFPALAHVRTELLDGAVRTSSVLVDNLQSLARLSPADAAARPMSTGIALPSPLTPGAPLGGILSGDGVQMLNSVINSLVPAMALSRSVVPATADVAKQPHASRRVLRSDDDARSAPVNLVAAYVAEAAQEKAAEAVTALKDLATILMCDESVPGQEPLPPVSGPVSCKLEEVLVDETGKLGSRLLLSLEVLKDRALNPGVELSDAEDAGENEDDSSHAAELNLDGEEDESCDEELGECETVPDSAGVDLEVDSEGESEEDAGEDGAD